MSNDPKVALFVPLPANPGEEGDKAVINFLMGGYVAVQAEPHTHQWFGIKFTSADPTANHTHAMSYHNGGHPMPKSGTHYAIFDTFTDAAGRTAHLHGPVGQALNSQGPMILSESASPAPVHILSSKVNTKAVRDKEMNKGFTVGMHIVLHAKPEKTEELREMLVNAKMMIDAEPETHFWYAFVMPGTSTFGIIDFFSNEAGKNAHLKGKFASSLMNSAPDLMEKPIEMKPFQVLGAKVRPPGVVDKFFRHVASVPGKIVGSS